MYGAYAILEWRDVFSNSMRLAASFSETRILVFAIMPFDRPVNVGTSAIESMPGAVHFGYRL